MSNALVAQLIQQGDAAIQTDIDEKNDAAATAVSKLFSLVNAGKLDVSVLDSLIAFAENPTSPTGTKAIGSGGVNSAETDAANVLMGTDKLSDGVKKALRKLLEGTLKVDDEGNPAVTSASDPKKLKDLEDENTKLNAALSSIGSAFPGVGIVNGDYTKFANDIEAKHKDIVKDESTKATQAEAAKHKATLPKSEVKKATDGLMSWVNLAEKPSMRNGRHWAFTDENFNGLKTGIEDLKNAAS